MDKDNRPRHRALARLAAVAGVSKTPAQDLMLGAGACAFAAILWWQAEKIPPPFFDPLGSAAVPKAIAGLVAVLALSMLLRAALAWPWQSAGAVLEYRPRPDLAIGIVCLCVSYVGTMHLRFLSFEHATILFLIAAAALLGRLDRRTLVIGISLALFMGFGATWLFTQVFFIDLPR